MVMRQRGQGTARDHMPALLINIEEMRKNIATDNEGFLNLIPKLDDNIFSNAGKDKKSKRIM